MTTYTMSRENYIDALEEKLKWISNNEKDVRYKNIKLRKEFSFYGLTSGETTLKYDSTDCITATVDSQRSAYSVTSNLKSKFIKKLNDAKFGDFSSVDLSDGEYSILVDKGLINQGNYYYNDYDLAWAEFVYIKESTKEMKALIKGHYDDLDRMSNDFEKSLSKSIKAKEENESYFMTPFIITIVIGLALAFFGLIGR